MKYSPNVRISDQHVETFSRDGVVFLKTMFSAEWVELLKTGVSRNLAEPEERTRIWDRNDKGQYTLYDSDNWRRIDEYRKFVFDSSTKEITAKLLNTSKVNFFLRLSLCVLMVCSSGHLGIRMNHTGVWKDLIL